MIRWLPDEPRDLVLLPMAARRALDRAGTKLSLAQWQSMPPAARARLATLGSAEQVDEAAVRRLASAGRVVTPIEEPDDPPPALTAILPELSAERWAALDVVSRHALAMYARKGREERVREVYASVMSSGESQSSR